MRISRGLPTVISPDSREEAEHLADLIQQNRATYRTLLIEAGALLFRGFGVKSVADFQQVSCAGTPHLVSYTGGGSPRKRVDGNVYTSTEYPRHQSIPMHCEETYFPRIPKNIWFFCAVPPDCGGQTPLGCMRRFLGLLDQDLVEEFCTRGIRYIYNLHSGNGFGRGWRDAFMSDDRDWVTAWLEERKVEYRWRGDGGLHMDLPGRVLRKHSETGETIWGNQVVNWHIDALPVETSSAIRRLYPSANEYPKHVTFGDGAPIPKSKINYVMESLASFEVTFDWRPGDVLWCDNERVAHGRRPFSGSRRILVALS